MPQTGELGAAFRDQDKWGQASGCQCPPFTASAVPRASGGAVDAPRFSCGRSCCYAWRFAAPLLPWKLLIFSQGIKTLRKNSLGWRGSL